MRMIDRLALYYERGATSRRASIETGMLLSEVREHFRRFYRLGFKRLSRQSMLQEWRPPLPYTGPEWIGEANGPRPLPTGPGWIGKRHNLHSDHHSDRRGVH